MHKHRHAFLWQLAGFPAVVISVFCNLHVAAGKLLVASKTVACDECYGGCNTAFRKQFKLSKWDFIGHHIRRVLIKNYDVNTLKISHLKKIPPEDRCITNYNQQLTPSILAKNPNVDHIGIRDNPCT
jgi:hypothetical protein